MSNTQNPFSTQCFDKRSINEPASWHYGDDCEWSCPSHHRLKVEYNSSLIQNGSGSDIVGVLCFLLVCAIAIGVIYGLEKILPAIISPGIRLAEAMRDSRGAMVEPLVIAMFFSLFLLVVFLLEDAWSNRACIPPEEKRSSTITNWNEIASGNIFNWGGKVACWLLRGSICALPFLGLSASWYIGHNWITPGVWPCIGILFFSSVFLSYQALSFSKNARDKGLCVLLLILATLGGVWQSYYVVRSVELTRGMPIKSVQELRSRS